MACFVCFPFCTLICCQLTVISYVTLHTVRFLNSLEKNCLHLHKIFLLMRWLLLLAWLLMYEKRHFICPHIFSENIYIFTDWNILRKTTLFYKVALQLQSKKSFCIFVRFHIYDVVFWCVGWIAFMSAILHCDAGCDVMWFGMAVAWHIFSELSCNTSTMANGKFHALKGIPFLIRRISAATSDTIALHIFTS